MTSLRPYQRDAVRAVLNALWKHQSALIAMATGLGKTVVMAEIARLGGAKGRRVLLLAHREELLAQASSKFERHAPGLRVGIERGADRVDLATLPDVVVASVQTLQRAARLERFPRNTFSLIMVDECHHATAAGYQRILDHFASAKVVGLTATPDRSDGAALGEVFTAAPFTYSIRDAIPDGWLVPIHQRRVTVEALHLEHVRTTAGDLNAGELERELLRDQVLHQVAGPLVELAGDRSTLVFCAGVEQAAALAEVIAVYGGNAAALSGATPSEQRHELLARFAGGELQYLVNVGVLTEGTDLPIASCIAVVRPTKSRSLYTQIVGRGMRVLPGLVDQLVDASERRTAIAASTKPNCLVLDFAGNAGRHVLVSALDVLAGRPVPDDVRAAAEAISSQRGTMDAQRLLDEATLEVQQRCQHRLLRVRPRYDVVDVDPFEVLAGLQPGSTNDNGGPASAAQVEALQRAGLQLDWPSISRSRASALLSAVTERREKGLCTPKQAMQLARRGLNPDLTFDEARAAIDAIANNGWKTPHHLTKNPRFRAAPRKDAAA